MRMSFLAIATLVACSKAREPESEFGENKVDIAKFTAVKYSSEAYPSWSQAHPDKTCPGKLSELDEYMKPEDSLDPWGHRYVMLCGPNLPAGAKYLQVKSLGPNGIDDGPPPQGDDVTSW